MFLGARFPASPTSRVKADENKSLVKWERSDHRKTLAGTRKKSWVMSNVWDRGVKKSTEWKKFYAHSVQTTNRS